MDLIPSSDSSCMLCYKGGLGLAGENQTRGTECILKKRGGGGWGGRGPSGRKHQAGPPVSARDWMAGRGQIKTLGNESEWLPPKQA